ncbi:MAG: cell envelope integrity protein TolA [Ottowia sp.]|nr:cell envelope integrity protein TolA [Ottowia sp.]
MPLAAPLRLLETHFQRWVKGRRAEEPFSEDIKRRVQVQKNAPAVRRAIFFFLQNKFLLWGMLISFIVHGVILLLHIKLPEISPLQPTEVPLEVVLVNARSFEKPKNPTVIAQANLNGGGDHDEGRATTPLPAMATAQNGALAKQVQRRAQQLAQERKKLLAQNETSYLGPRTALASAQVLTETVPGKDAESVQMIRQRLEAEIAREQQHIAKRPRRSQLTAGNAIAAEFAQYYDAVRKKIEHYGTLNFPHANGSPLYGSLVLILNVRQNGQLGYAQDGYAETETTLRRSSGNAVLDRQAIAIVKAAAPFGPFTQQMRSQYDILEIIFTFNFTHTGFSASTHIE